MPFSISGKPSASLYSLPRGCVRVAELDLLDYPGPWRDMGSVQAFSISNDSQFAESFSTCGENRVRDAYTPYETTSELTMTVKEILDTQNRALAVAGNASLEDANTILSLAPGVIQIPNPAYTGDLQFEDMDGGGKFYPLFRETVDSGGSVDTLFAYGAGAGRLVNPAGTGQYLTPSWLPSKQIYNVDGSLISIKGPASVTPTANNGSTGAGAEEFTPGTHFEVLEAMGQIFIPKTGAIMTLVGTIGAANVSERFVRLNLSTSATENHSEYEAKLPTIDALTSASRAVALQIYQQDSQRRGFRSVLNVFKTRLTATGETDYISDGTDFSTFDLTGSLETPQWANSSVGNRGLYSITELRSS